MAQLRAIDSKVLCFILLNWFAAGYSTNGIVTISPTPRAALCRVGDRLEVTCTTTQNALTWNLTVVEATNSITRTLSTTTQNQDFVMINSAILIFSRVSELRAFPLISMLVVPAVSQGLNGTRITCKERSTTAASMATTSVYIYKNAILISIGILSIAWKRAIADKVWYHPNPPNITSEEHFEAERVIISLHWTQEPNESLLSYSISIVPRINTTIYRNGNTSLRANLLVAYNTQYNVSILADFCGQRNSITHIEVIYSKCTDPKRQLLDDSLIILGYTSPVLVGNSIQFTCPAGLQISGAISSMCMGNGEWEPDISEVECKANCGQPSLPVNGYILPYTSTFEGTKVTYICDKDESLYKEIAICTKLGQWIPNTSSICEEARYSGGLLELLSRDGKIAVGSSVTVFVVASILFFIVGFLCGLFCQKKKDKMNFKVEETIPTESSEKKQTPYYENIDQFDIQPNHLKRNVAYGPILL